MTPYYEVNGITIHCGDCRTLLATLPEQSVQCVVTSPPYFGLRNYNVEGQIGLEETPAAYVAEMVAVFREVRRVLRDDGTVWLNIGDSYAAGKQGRADHGSDDSTVRLSGNTHGAVSPGPIRQRSAPDGFKPKDLIGIPWRVAFALQEDGWYLRSDIIWHKPNPMPESVTDRPTRSHEYIFLLSKNSSYFYDGDAIREPYEQSSLVRFRTPYDSSNPANQATQNPSTKRDGLLEPNPAGRNKRDVWTITTHGYPAAHFATFPPKLIEPCILAGAPAGGVVLDPFAGAGTTLLVAKNLNRRAIGIELNPDYCDLAAGRLGQHVLPLAM